MAVAGPPSRKRFHCDVCNDLFVSYDLKHHYEAKTNWEQLERLRSGVEEDRGQVDPHTLYMWTKKYSKTSLPSYVYHK
jgi:hypothetical protein